MTELEYFKSEEFQKRIQDTINKNTWDKGLPKYYLDNTGWIVEHWKDGTIIKLKKHEYKL